MSAVDPGRVTQDTPFSHIDETFPPATPVRNVPRCDPGDNPQDDLAQAFVVTRPGDSVVFFDGNNFTTNTFVRAGRPDALGDLSPTVPALVRAALEAARGDSMGSVKKC